MRPANIVARVGEQPMTAERQRDEVWQPAMKVVGDYRRACFQIQAGKTAHYDPDDLLFRMQVWVRPGIYLDYEGNPVTVLGLEVDETYNVLVQLMREGQALKRMMLVDFLKPENSSKGDSHRLGIAFVRISNLPATAA